MDDAATLAAALSAAVGDLDVYIGRKAAEMAAPAIAEAERAANEAIRQAEREVERKEDLIGELKRRLAALERQREDAYEASHRIAVALGGDPRCTYPGFPAVAANAERRLAEDAATIERLRAEKLDAIQGHLVADVLLPAMSSERESDD